MLVKGKGILTPEQNNRRIKFNRNNHSLFYINIEA